MPIIALPSVGRLCDLRSEINLVGQDAVLHIGQRALFLGESLVALLVEVAGFATARAAARRGAGRKDGGEDCKGKDF